MFETIGLMIVPSIILVIVATIIFVKVLSRGEQKYDVFMIEGNELVVLAGIPVRYRINDIETVTFSNVLGKYGSFVGIMKINDNGSISLTNLVTIVLTIVFSSFENLPHDLETVLTI